jgi:hypothetical protein
MPIRVFTAALALGAALAACDGAGGPSANDDRGDRRVDELRGAESTASPNIDAAAAANQTQIPVYPPPAAGETPTPPR